MRDDQIDIDDRGRRGDPPTDATVTQPVALVMEGATVYRL